jgi:thymidine kinase
MDSENNEFYFKGVFYNDEDSFWKGVKQQQLSRVTRHSLHMIIYHLEYDLLMNLFEMCQCTLVNEEIEEIIADALGSIIVKIRKKEKEKMEPPK